MSNETSTLDGQDILSNEQILVDEIFAMRRQILSIAFGVLRDFSKSEDAFQEICLAAFRDREQFVGKKEQLRPWLYSIARHVSLDILRKERSKKRHGGKLSIDMKYVDEGLFRDRALRSAISVEPAQPASIEIFENSAAWDVIDALPAQQRRIFDLRMQGFSCGAMSALLGSSENAVKVNLHRIYRKFRQHPQSLKQSPKRPTLPAIGARHRNLESLEGLSSPYL